MLIEVRCIDGEWRMINPEEPDEDLSFYCRAEAAEYAHCYCSVLIEGLEMACELVEYDEAGKVVRRTMYDDTCGQGEGGTEEKGCSSGDGR